MQRRGHGHTAALQRRGHPVLPLHGVRRGEQLTGRLLAQHVARAVAADQAVGGIGLPAREALHGQRRTEAVERSRQIAFQRDGVEVDHGLFVVRPQR